MKMAWLFCITLALAGCEFTNRSYLRETLAALPSGDLINGESEVVDHFGSPTQSHSMIVWRRQSDGEHLVAIVGQGEMRVKDAGKVLQVKGDPHRFYELRTNTPPAVHVSDNGNRAWLVAQDKVLASFDYDAGTATFGDDQPAWAAPATR